MVCAATLFVVVPGAPARADPPRLDKKLSCDPQTKFAGYDKFTRDITQISATWTVPANHGTAGTGSTWIGLGSGPQHFIQIGTDEIRPYEEAGFWSGTKVQDMPQQILLIPAGDVVRATIARDGSKWRLSLTDLTTGKSASISNSEGVYFTTASWLQEDRSQLCTLTTYPAISITFRSVQLDGSAPDLTTRTTAGLVLEPPNGVYLTPGPLRDDAFTLAPPTGRAARYLDASGPMNVALEEWIGRVATTRYPVLDDSALTDANASLRAARHFRSVLRSRQWDPALARRTSALIDAIEGAIARYRRSGRWTFSKVLGSVARMRPAADRLRLELRLPRIGTTQIVIAA